MPLNALKNDSNEVCIVFGTRIPFCILDPLNGFILSIRGICSKQEKNTLTLPKIWKSSKEVLDK